MLMNVVTGDALWLMLWSLVDEGRETRWAGRR